MTNHLTEREIIRIWQSQLLEKKELVTEDGEPIRIIYPGRTNDEEGADFRDAVIAGRCGLIKGDIEVHLKSSDWQSHRHHQDAAYNRVILHVVLWHNVKHATNLQNKSETPVLALDKYLKNSLILCPDSAPPHPDPLLPCRKIRPNLPTAILTRFLARAGEKRFGAKAERFHRDLRQIAASQALYQGIMGALGYSKNKLSFLELARRLPQQLLESTNQAQIPAAEYLVQQQAWLLGSAGLLPSQCQDRCSGNDLDAGWLDKLEKFWAAQHHEATPASVWHLFKVRPSNSPARRLVAMSYLQLRYRERGLLEGLVGLVKEASPHRDYLALEKGLLVTAPDLRANPFPFTKGRGQESTTLLGRERAADIIVNVLLPFTFAWSQSTAQPELAQSAFDLYRHYPKLSANAVERHMLTQLGLNRTLANSARRQQGLIHIYQTLCTQGKCHGCPLNKERLAESC